MHGWRGLMFIFVVFCVSGRLAAEPLPWSLLPLPGVVELTDGRPSGGLQMQALELLAEQMPGVQPSYRAVSRLRQLHDMAAGEDFCAAPFFFTEEGGAAGYYVPFVLSTPIQVVIRRDSLKRFAVQQQRLSLPQLLADRGVSGALAAGRTYPLELRSSLLDARDRGQLGVTGGRVGGENLLLMIAAGRVDYGFEFAIVTRQINQLPQVANALINVPLQEPRELVESGIYCTRSAWGKEMALRLDRAIRTVAAKPQPLLELYRQWLPAETFAAYRQQLAQAYIARSQMPALMK